MAWPTHDDGPGIGVWTVALGVFIGGLAAAFTYEASIWLRAEWALQQAQHKMQEEARAAQARLQAEQQAARIREAERRGREAEQLRRQAEQDAARRTWAKQREQLWKEFFKPAPKCAEASTDMDCVNAYMRAKKAFDEKYPP
jgi:hypothetical protein